MWQPPLMKPFLGPQPSWSRLMKYGVQNEVSHPKMKVIPDAVPTVCDRSLCDGISVDRAHNTGPCPIPYTHVYTMLSPTRALPAAVESGEVTVYTIAMPNIMADETREQTTSSSRRPINSMAGNAAMLPVSAMASDTMSQMYGSPIFALAKRYTELPARNVTPVAVWPAMQP